LALEDGMSDTAWAQSARSQPPACWSRLPAGRTGQYKGDSCQPQVQFVLVRSGKDGAVSAGTVPHNRISVLDSEADRPKVIFLAER
jgi:hypothetical protein